jgi:hypothetical protein
MGAQNKRQVGECPKCHKPIFEGHPYPWCIECGERFTESFLSGHPDIYKHTPYTGPKEEGPKVYIPPRVLGYGLVSLGILILITPIYWHPNYSTQTTMLKMAFPAFLCIASGLRYFQRTSTKER